MGSSQRRLEVLLVAAVTAYAAWGLHEAPSWTVDDAYIVARYADNLVQHHRFLWNVDEPPVEGFTSVLALLFGAAAALFHLSPTAAAIALGQVAYVACAPLVLALGRALRAPAPAAGIVALVHVAMAEHITHATSGLETEVFLALCLALAIVTARALRGHAFAHVVILAILVMLTRPEGIAAAGIAIFAARRFRGVIWFVIPFTLLTTWRWTTFGELLPNTYYAKHGPWNTAHLHDLGRLFGDTFLDLFAASAAIVVLAGLRPFARVERTMVLVAVGVIAAQSYGYARAEPIMDYAKRFAMNDLPWLDVLAIVAVSAALRTRRFGVLLALATFTCAQRGVANNGFEQSFTRGYVLRMVQLSNATAWVDAHASPDATVAVYPDAGILPYRTKRRVIDFGKLSDRTLAHHHAPAEVADYFFARAPELLVVGLRPDGGLEDEGAAAILADSRFTARYSLAYRKDAYSVYARR